MSQDNEMTEVVTPQEPQAQHHRELLNRWCEAVAYEAAHGRLTVETSRTYRSAINGWGRHLAIAKLDAPAASDLYGWLGELRYAGRSAATCNKILSAMRACYAWLSLGQHYSDITRGLRPFRSYRDGALPAFTRGDVEKMLLARETSSHGPLPAAHEAIARLRDEALLRVLYATGMRLVSMVRLDVSDAQLGERIVLRHQSKGRDQKSEVAVLPANASRVLAAYLEARSEAGLRSEPLWIGLWPRPGSRLSAKSIRALVSRRAASIGLRPRGTDGRLQWPRVYGPHALRRSACVAVVDRFGLEAGQILLGHASSEQTRQSYARAEKFRVLSQVADTLDLDV